MGYDVMLTFTFLKRTIDCQIDAVWKLPRTSKEFCVGVTCVLGGLGIHPL